MGLLIDAYNVLHASTEEAADSLSVEDLASLIGASRYAGRKTTLVCDGLGQDGRHRLTIRGITIVYSGRETDADSIIERLIQRDSAPKRLTVVSSDRRIQQAARRRRAASVASDRFLAHLIRDAAGGPQSPARPAFARDIPLDPYSVEQWMREFGYAGKTEPSRARSSHRSARPADPASERSKSRNKTGTRKEPEANEDLPPKVELPRGQEIDPLIREALREFNGRLRLEDLEMEQWLEGQRGKSGKGRRRSSG